MNKILRIAGVSLLVFVLICSLAACGQRAAETQTEEAKEIVVETPPASPTPSATPTPSVPAVAVTTVPMPMPSVSPTPGVTATETPVASTAEPVATATASPSPSVSPSPTPTPYSAAAAFASTIRPDGALVPDSAVPGYVAGNDVAFRAGPSTSARLIASLLNGTYVDIVGVEGDWTEVIINGVYGYIRSDYVARGSYYVSGPGGSGSSVGGNSSTVIVIPSDATVGSAVIGSSPTPETDFLGIRPD